MIRYLFLLISFFVSCETLNNYQQRKKATIVAKNAKLHYYYIYSYKNDSSVISDSLMMASCPNQKTTNYSYGYNDTCTLLLYQDKETFNKTVSDILHLYIFNLHNQKWACIMDTTTRLYLWRKQKIVHSCTLPAATPSYDPTWHFIDINGDKYKDIVLEIPCGGTCGSENYCIFYNPTKQVLEYNIQQPEIRNFIINSTKYQIVSRFNYSSSTYQIEHTNFLPLRDTVYLRYTSDDTTLYDYGRVDVFDRQGNIISADTISLGE